MTWFRKVAVFIVLAVILFGGYLFFNLVRFESKQITTDSIVDFQPADSALHHFSEALKIKTISPENPIDFDSIAFDQFTAFLASSYPLANSLLDKKNFLKYSTLYTWKGSDPSLSPAVLMAHMDVVPVIGANTTDWKYGAFDGKIAEDTVWGRGTLDDKINVIALMESVEQLLSQGYIPQRTLYISFGHDEELGGQGAQAIATYLKAEGIRPEFVLDEGSVIASGLIPGVASDVALVGIAEKGFATIHLSVEIEGGHSSFPANETAIDVLAAAIYKVKSNPFPAVLSDPLKQFFSFVGPEMDFPNNLVFANVSVFSPVIKKIYESSNTGNANVRTTTSPTVFHSGIKENVIPKRATASINFRIVPGETTQSVMDRVQTLIDDDRVKLSLGDFISDPSPVSDPESDAFKLLQQTINQVFPDALVAPGMVVVATDSRHFSDISQNTFRFLPIRLDRTNISSIHGINERVAVSEYYTSIQFYGELIKKL